MKDAFHVKANHLESGVWMNRAGKQGELKFEWIAFRGTGTPFLVRVENGVGSRLEFHYSQGTNQVYEIQAGTGYLGQSPGVIQVKSEGLESIEVRWPGIKNIENFLIGGGRVSGLHPGDGEARGNWS